MDIKDLVGDAKNLTDWEFERRLNKLVRDNSRYYNLDDKNKKVILDLVKKYKPKLRKGIGISSTNLDLDRYRLRRDRLKLGLSEEDLKDMDEFIKGFKH